MGGGLLQLVAYGAQDVYLTGNPQITFWKVSYRRYTNFSMESIAQDFNGTAQLGGRVTCQISRNGDLIHKMYLEVTASAVFANATCSAAPYAMLNYVEVEIGGQRIDRHYGDWMYIWNKLTLPFGKFGALSALALTETTLAASSRTTVPLEFWFCRNPGLALPLIALQYHEVKVNIQFETAAKISSNGGTTTYSISTATLWVDYIFLDTDERRRMAQNPHEYLIDQLQFTGEEALTGTSATSNASIRLNFNHPVKELVWVLQVADAAAATRFNTYVSMVDTANCNLQLNGQDRFAKRNPDYFSIIQPLQCHSNAPVAAGFSTSTSAATSNINVYSFALRPEEHQPSGTCNFSRIDSAVLNFVYNGSAGGNFANVTRARVYAVNYNVLRIMSGMGGLAYSN
jgi:hypothetical protein